MRPCDCPICKLKDRVEKLESENTRLRAALEQAWIDGWDSGHFEAADQYVDFPRVLAALATTPNIESNTSKSETKTCASCAIKDITIDAGEDIIAALKASCETLRQERDRAIATENRMSRALESLRHEAALIANGIIQPEKEAP